MNEFLARSSTVLKYFPPGSIADRTHSVQGRHNTRNLMQTTAKISMQPRSLGHRQIFAPIFVEDATYTNKAT